MKLSSWLQFTVASHWKPEFARTCPQAASESGGFTQLLQLTSELSSHAREPEGGKGKYCFFNGFTRINQASLGKKQMLRQGHFTSPFLWGTYIVQNRVGISWQQNTRLYQWQMTDKTPFQKDNKTFYNEEHLTTSSKAQLNTGGNLSSHLLLKDNIRACQPAVNKHATQLFNGCAVVL